MVGAETAEVGSSEKVEFRCGVACDLASWAAAEVGAVGVCLDATVASLLYLSTYLPVDERQTNYLAIASVGSKERFTYELKIGDLREDGGHDA